MTVTVLPIFIIAHLEMVIVILILNVKRVCCVAVAKTAQERYPADQIFSVAGQVRKVYYFPMLYSSLIALF